MLLVHGTGHNLAVWAPLAECLRAQGRVAAFDLRGHGQTPQDSSGPEQYWRDIGAVAAALDMHRPWLVGHSTGGYAVTAFAAAGGDCAGIVALDGFVLDARQTPEERQAWHLPREQLWDLFRYGWHAAPAEVDDYVAQVCAQAPGDWLNAGVPVERVAAFTRRAFLALGDGRLLRRPTLEEIALVSQPDPAESIFPSVDLYERLDVPAGFVLATRGLYASRRPVLEAVVARRANRRLRVLDANHNVHLQQPQAVADFVTEMLNGLTNPP
ncbi:MAG TPA: alpha/beta hydrolase [Burkholderiaceae bacterium]|nr:alpha/beta hydrolase [Burkholderiaceae bacterium]HNB45351.1 alpha/beta hydrolase [Burkholderiaceae bacterium]HNG82373.1 alpha/beta hydrolase [Burkholderiaceae bacterium]